MKTIRFFLLITFLVCYLPLLFGQESEVRFGERPLVDIYLVPDEAMDNRFFRIKFHDSYTRHLDDVEVTRDESGIISFGLSELDELNRRFSVHSISRLTDSYALRSEYSWRHRQWGFHLWYELYFESEEDIRDIIMAYRGLDKIISWAEPEYKKEVSSSSRNNIRWTPNDPLFSGQWHYHNTGQSGATPGCDISLVDAWNFERGHPDVIVAILDSGIQEDHPDLAGNILPGGGYNYVPDYGGYLVPGDHGTHVAGTVSALSNNNVGVAGVAGGSGNNDGVRLMSHQIFKENPAPESNEWATSNGIAFAMIHAADLGAAINQNSWVYVDPGYPIYSQVVLDAIDYFNSNGGGDVMNGGITVFSAGNYDDENYDSSDEYYPACYSGAIAVASTNNHDWKAYYSNYGSWVDISAPGGETYNNIYNPGGVRSTVTGNSYAFFEGTSMAAPHVSGVAALIISYARRYGVVLDNNDVTDILLSTTDDHYGGNPDYIGMLGTGRLNALSAIIATQSYIASPPSLGNGTTANPYRIDSFENLLWVQLDPSRWDKHFIQTANIDASATEDWFGGEGWFPIGKTTAPFTGSYNGQGHTIDGLYVNRPDSEDIGLFGFVSGATISNLGVTNVNISGFQRVGGLIGLNINNSNVTNCFTTGNITAVTNVGGLIGRNYTSTVNKCYSSCTVLGAGNVIGAGLNVSGLIGWNDNSTTSNSYSSGDVSGVERIGGLIGLNNQTPVSTSYSIGGVNGSNSVGGLIGSNSGSAITNSYWNVDTSDNASSAGGEGRTTSEMTYPYDANTYVEWDFGGTWRVDIEYDISGGYPFLQWQVDESYNTTPDVNIVHVSQRNDGSMLVDIYYDVFDAEGDEMTVSLQVSDDGGDTWNISANEILAGSDIGSGIYSGSDKHIVWGFGAEHSGVFSENYYFKVLADDRQTGLTEVEWCLIPAGNFTYGSGNTILNIDYDYEIMKYEVTNAQYLAYLQEAYAAGDIWVSGSEVQGYYPGDQHWGAGNYLFYELGTDLWGYNFGRISYSNGQFILNYPSAFTEEDYLNHPVVCVSWFGAWHFADYYGWRLPTEYEWEKAARGMTGYDYPWGNTIDGSRANYWGSGDPYDNGTTPVGFYNGETHLVNGVSFTTTDSPSSYGVYDMAGNVWNWTDSFWSSTISRRVVRGGGWSNGTDHLRSWYRHLDNPAYDYGSYGFRCVRTQF
jgi:formylglycine-generating enzyme required for sulfatase activity/subtilisin family serine protease